MILCVYKEEVGGGNLGEGGGCLPRKDIGRPEERAGRDKHSYVTINNRA